MAAIQDRRARCLAAMMHAIARSVRRSLVAVPLLLSAIVLPMPAAAQTDEALTSSSPEGGPPSQLVQVPEGCMVIAQPGEDDAVQTLVANCRGHGLILGQATDYRTFTNEALEATIVDMHLGSERRVWLLSLTESGPPLLEDIGGQIADAGGLGPMAAIEGLEIDFESFAREAVVGVRSADSTAFADGTVRWLPLDQQIVRERIALTKSASED